MRYLDGTTVPGDSKRPLEHSLMKPVYRGTHIRCPCVVIQDRFGTRTDPQNEPVVIPRSATDAEPVFAGAARGRPSDRRNARNGG